MRAATGIITALGASLVALAAQAEASKIGVAAPLSGPQAILGQQIRAGAEQAAAATGAVLTVSDDSCSAEGGTNAAEEFIAAGVAVATGFLCTEALEAALPHLKDANIPVITTGVRTNSVTDSRSKTGWQVFRLGPRGDSERDAAAAILTRLWQNELFAIIDDGTIYGRELAESLRAAAEQAGLKPVFVDTFRPQLDNQVALIGRLRKAGATHVFVGGDGEDIAVMGRDAAAQGLAMVFAGGDTLNTADLAVLPASGTLMIAPPQWASLASAEVLQRLEAEKIVAEGYVLPAYAAVEIASAASALAATGGKPLTEVLSGNAFQTAIGRFRFDAKGDLTQNLYRLFRFDGTNFVPVD
ncbi:branched-chain amino acid ABC transporter substrate-binding protein [Aminobacter sp. HY435]|uniref:branched-chain amino acid ABC transporter substrate-binding protein n=1 Tax=Aminobacter sp. HY435 TaxID=2970917 RepID=UPI0022B97448|nr:branched-chain amino acid ABC transporter substrate-binding protein [Aminobacter sp. HY435]